MYVKSLTIKGFKSFADPVTLELQPGVNVVVGPNGSGKSNVIDAVAWVLGAQGAKSLRGGKMDDVIFAGTGKRSALGRAEVSLTIDNGDGRLPVDFSEVTITRTLFRTGESEYAMNSVPCRLLDIQELLSDSGVGRQQHVIVSQGNLSAILNARPEDRRMVVEEAAGVLKYRKRRERSQRRLEGTESNLERLQDLVREVRQQLRPLQKQAEAARRHDSVATELRQLRLFTAGRDIEQLRHRQSNAEAEAAQMLDRDAELRRLLSEADVTVAAAESAMAAFSGEDLGEHVERMESLFQRARGLGALLAERRRSVERDLASSVSKDVVAQLESDAANVRREMADVEAEKTALAEPFEQIASTEAALATAWLDFEAEWGEGLPVQSNEAGQIRGESAAIEKNLAASVQEAGRRRERVAQLETQSAQAAADVERLTAERNQAQASLAQATTLIEGAEAANTEALAAFEAAEGAFREAQQRASVAAARVEALSSALDGARARAGVERLAEVDGIVGTLAELVDIDDGYQAAFEAAAGEAMAAVVVDSLDAARAALTHLRAGDADGAVLVLGQPYGVPGQAPAGTPVENLRAHVRGTTPAVETLLDRVLCCAVVVQGDWRTAVDFTLEYPDLIVVTERGDRFSRGGWRVGTGGAGATGAAVAQAEAERTDAEASLAELQQAFTSARQARDAAAAAEREARKAIGDHERRIASLESTLERTSNRIESLASEIETGQSNLAELEGRINAERSRHEELQLRLPGLEAAEASGEERARMWREARSVLEEQSTHVRSERSKLEVRSRSLDERTVFLGRRLEALDTRLEQHKIEVEQAAQRRLQLEAKMNVIDRLRSIISSRLETLEGQVAEVRERRNVERERRRAVSDQLEEARKHRSGLERDVMANNEQKQSHELRIAEVKLRLETVLETLERELEVSPEEAIATDEPELPDGRTAKQRTAELERELRHMGPINPLALEEYEQVQERHQFLDQQLQDVQESRRELVRVIRAVDAEIQETFASAYEDVARNFQDLIGMLFPGGSGQLKLTDPDNPLETGIEIEARPSGKNVRTLSLLSGGERSLVAMAFLFAVFRSRPSPFYLLDEVEAALDDMNLGRMLMLIEEFRAEAQLVIVSHQKRTMEIADTLYGVSMQPGGSSKVVSEKLVKKSHTVKASEIDLREQPVT